MSRKGSVPRYLSLVLFVLCEAIFANTQTQKRPNILVIFGDDIGWFNLSAYNMGMMGYRTPNIDLELPDFPLKVAALA